MGPVWQNLFSKFLHALFQFCNLHVNVFLCRIFPTSETWNNYGALLEYSSTNNLILHENLFPDVTMKPANRVSFDIIKTVVTYLISKVRSRFKAGFNEVRKRSQSAGPGKFDKRMGKEDSFDQVGPTKPLTKWLFA